MWYLQTNSVFPPSVVTRQSYSEGVHACAITSGDDLNMLRVRRAYSAFDVTLWTAVENEPSGSFRISGSRSARSTLANGVAGVTISVFGVGTPARCSSSLRNTLLLQRM